jgi:hypothetical protein
MAGDRGALRVQPTPHHGPSAPKSLRDLIEERFKCGGVPMLAFDRGRSLVQSTGNPQKKRRKHRQVLAPLKSPEDDAASVAFEV